MLWRLMYARSLSSWSHRVLDEMSQERLHIVTAYSFRLSLQVQWCTVVHCTTSRQTVHLNSLWDSTWCIEGSPKSDMRPTAESSLASTLRAREARLSSTLDTVLALLCSDVTFAANPCRLHKLGINYIIVELAVLHCQSKADVTFRWTRIRKPIKMDKNMME